MAPLAAKAGGDLVSDSATRARRDSPESTTEYERSLIGCAIRDEKCAERLISEVPTHYWRDSFHKAAMTEAARQWGVDQIFDPMRLGKALREKHRDDTFDPVYYLCQLATFENLPSTTCFDSRLAEVLKAGVKQRIYLAADHAAEASLNGGNPADILRHLRADLEDIECDTVSPLVLPKASSFESQSVDWLWDKWLHRGGLTLLDGDPERGKSQITCDMVGRVTSPRPFPFVAGDDFRIPLNVLMAAGEDGIETTLRPRLEAAGADLDRVFIWPESEDPFTLPSGIGTLTGAVKQHGIGLLVIDPLGAYLGEDVNANRDADVRRALRPLVALAQETNMAVLAVRHLNKDENKSALYRGGGSIAFTAAARVVWAVGNDPGDPQRRILAVLKSNIATKPPALSYTIESHGTTSRIKWEGESTYTANDIFAHKRQRGGKGEDADAFLAELLANGPRPATEVEQLCTDAGFKHWTYKQARKRLGVTSSKGSMREGWLLSLPEGDGFEDESPEEDGFA